MGSFLYTHIFIEKVALRINPCRFLWFGRRIAGFTNGYSCDTYIC
jgi:hypothetical protein